MDKINGFELITSQREIFITAENQSTFCALVTEVEENLFWTNLPREEGQVMVLEENQPVTLGISLFRGYYSAESKVIALGDKPKGFYGFAMPDYFSISHEREFIRAEYASRIDFECGDRKVQTSLVNFSANGVMVYLVPQLEEIIKGNQWHPLYVKNNLLAEKAAVKLTWQKTKNNVKLAGFEFINLPNETKEELNKLAVKYTKEV
ncbi:hypothetical protein N752_30860 [Desulforamulus aquiferis]|nr:PilZ domain-containing protein [Desulforamulus aquiferis]RYD01398.1 hypothetical protein N752_30860 [Desulforamulus aquiferis]